MGPEWGGAAAERRERGLGRDAPRGLGRAIVAMSLVTVMLLDGSATATLAWPAFDATAKIDGRVMAETDGGRRAPVIVYLTDQADLRAAKGVADRDARGWLVFNTLTEHAARTQAGLAGLLRARGVTFRSFWAANMVALEADRGLVEVLAARHDVGRIDSDRPTRWIDDPVLAPAEGATTASTSATLGVLNVRAPDVWSLGHMGEGIVIASQDTGVRWTHSAIMGRYRGWNGSTADHNYNWHDAIHAGGGACGANTTAPCDDNGHGTHTVGTFAGADGAGNAIGVAPGAQWIGCRNMDRGWGTPSSYAECFEFFLAPTDLQGANPDPARRPHVINNSWVCTVSEGCTSGAELASLVANAEAAGIFIVAAAGNDGAACDTIRHAPAIYPGSFTVGAIDAGTNALASFSSRGPATYGGQTLVKPNLSAPGVSVRSADRTSDTAYSNRSGTSMAAPHVAGVVALLWSARPELARDIAQTRSLLERSANGGVVVSPAETCAGISAASIPNYSFGYGRIDALAAFEAAVSGTPAPTPSAVPTPTTAPTATVAPTPTPFPTPTPTPTTAPTPPTVELPGAPLDVTATAADGAAHISWRAPASDGGTAISTYAALSSPGGLGCSTAGALSCTVAGLANGTSYTFTVRATNAVGSGPPSAPSNSITPTDTTAPAVGLPALAFVSPQRVGGNVLARVSWPAAQDTAGVHDYRLQRSQDGGSWTTVTLPSSTATSVNLALASGHDHRFRLQASDLVGNASAYATTPVARLGRAQEGNAAITWSGSWKRVTLSGASGGYVRRSASTGSRATYSFNGTAVALVATRGPSYGRAEVRLDGTLVATLDFYSSTRRTRRVVWASPTLAAGGHVLEVRVTGTRNPASSGVRVDVDCFQRWSPAI